MRFVWMCAPIILLGGRVGLAFWVGAGGVQKGEEGRDGRRKGRERGG
jgi:hypothetical protein